jgi:transposase InsO family protein
MDVRLLAAISEELDGLNVAALCRERGVSRKTFYKWKARFVADGLAGLEARSRRPHRSPDRISDRAEDLIVEIRKRLVEDGFDAGPATIHYHLRNRGLASVPSEATIWRVLRRRGFVTLEPKKRPRTTYRRFEAAAPNECWQIDATHWGLLGGREVEIINVLDDHSRLAVGNRAVKATTTEEAWLTFADAAGRWGMPLRCLSDNGLAFSGRLRGMQVFFETNLKEAGITPVTSRPFHPQTCGKVERFQQTLKKWLAAQPPVSNLHALQAQLDEFRGYYNYVRPHRATGRRPPFERWAAQPAAASRGAAIRTPDRRLRLISSKGSFRINHYQIQLGLAWAGKEALVVIDAGYAVVFVEGSLVRHLRLDTTRQYQPSGLRPGGKRSDGT